MANPTSSITLDYPIKCESRYGYGKPYHRELETILARDRGRYREILTGFLKYKEFLLRIPPWASENAPLSPAWCNAHMPALDGVAIYGFLANTNGAHYVEVGSGWTTKFALRAIADQGLRTKITSIDPLPRVDIDVLCDVTIRKPLEDTDLGLFEKLDAGDIVFIDGSHCCFTNSDVTVVFLEILPRLKPGVIVEFHDIFLPLDYPPQWSDKHYSEQYLLACYLLAEGNKFNVLLPGVYISNDAELQHVLDPLWQEPAMKEVIEHFAVSFWLEIAR